jgi:hypothetical protein
VSGKAFDGVSGQNYDYDFVRGSELYREYQARHEEAKAARMIDPTHPRLRDYHQG